MIATKSFAALKPNSPLVPHTINRRDLKPNDVLINIEFCGICHSDLHQVENDWSEGTFPMVPGHEIVGTIEKIGADVKDFAIGDKVGVGCLVNSCQQCGSCLNHDEQFCENGASFTYNSTEYGEPTYGGYSSKIVVNKNFVLKMPENLPIDAAAPLLCAGITTYSPLKRFNVKHGDKVAIAGLGGLGHMGLKIAKAMGAHVTVLSSSASKKQTALDMGADNFIVVKELPQDFQGSQFDLILDTISAQHDFNLFINLLKVNGVLALVGAPAEVSNIDTKLIVMGQKHIAGSLIGGIKITQEMLDFCGKHNITCLIEKINMDYVNKAFERLKVNDVKYRFVIDMASLA